MALTVGDIFDDVEADTQVDFQTAGSAIALTSHGFSWLKQFYDFITDNLQLPQGYDTQNSVVGQRAYNLPADIYGGFTGIISVEWNSIPLAPKTLREMQDAVPSNSSENWLTASYLSSPMYFFPEDDPTKFSILKAPESIATIRVIHLQSVAIPTLTTDVVPQVFEPFREAFALFLEGKLMGPTRGAQMRAQARSLVLQKSRQRRRRLKPKVRENYAQALDLYRNQY